MVAIGGKIFRLAFYGVLGMVALIVFEKLTGGIVGGFKTGIKNELPSFLK